MARDVDEYLDGVGAEFRCSAKEIVELMRTQLGDADEQVDGDTALFSRDGNTVTGLRIGNGKIQIVAPDNSVAEEFAERLGDVKQSQNCLEFQQLVDIRRSELKKFIDTSSNHAPPKDAKPES